MRAKHLFRIAALCGFFTVFALALYSAWSAYFVGVYVVVLYACGELAIADEAERRKAEEAAEKPQLVIPPFAGK